MLIDKSVKVGRLFQNWLFCMIFYSWNYTITKQHWMLNANFISYVRKLFGLLQNFTEILTSFDATEFFLWLSQSAYQYFFFHYNKKFWFVSVESFRDISGLFLLLWNIEEKRNKTKWLLDYICMGHKIVQIWTVSVKNLGRSHIIFLMNVNSTLWWYKQILIKNTVFLYLISLLNYRGHSLL